MVTDFPAGAQAYLRTTYGLLPYAREYLSRLVRLGSFPEPTSLTPKRRVTTFAALDAYAAATLAQVGLRVEGPVRRRSPVARAAADLAQIVEPRGVNGNGF
jgi:hypothetical protein